MVPNAVLSSAFFVITPIGFLHEYPSSASPRGAPTFSVFLPSAALGPLPTPGVSKSGRNREPKFIIESRAAKGKNKEISKVYRAKSWDEVRMWWNASEKVRSPRSSLSRGTRS